MTLIKLFKSNPSNSDSTPQILGRGYRGRVGKGLDRQTASIKDLQAKSRKSNPLMGLWTTENIDFGMVGRMTVPGKVYSGDLYRAEIRGWAMFIIRESFIEAV